jgi:CelD/BcsL family acetyltransferase involved in cellulose biosynthesis
MTATTEWRVISNAAELGAIETEWWSLWRRIPTATPFQSPAWLLPWRESFCPGTLQSIAVHRNDRLIGLAPLYLETGPRGRRLLPLGISVSDYLDVLLDPECLEIAAEAMASAVMESGSWQSWELSDLGPCAQATALPCLQACEDSLDASETCPFMALPAKPEDLRRALPQRKRRSLRLDRNRAERRGTLTFCSLADCSAEGMLAELVRLHSLRWESRGEAGVLGDPRVRNFHAHALPRLAAAGLARLYALRIGQHIAAVYYGFLHDRYAYAYLTGMDPAFADESPGTLLLAHAMEEAIREGAREFHFLRGGEAYKYGWGAVDRWNRRRVFHRRSADAAA